MSPLLVASYAWERVSAKITVKSINFQYVTYSDKCLISLSLVELLCDLAVIASNDALDGSLGSVGLSEDALLIGVVSDAVRVHENGADRCHTVHTTLTSLLYAADFRMLPSELDN